MDTGDKFAAALIGFAVLIVAAGIVMFAAEEWQDAQDKRQCRVHGGTVVHADNEWHCVGARPEVR